MLRKLHQHSTDMGEQDTLLLTQVLHYRMHLALTYADQRCSAEIPVPAPAACSPSVCHRRRLGPSSYPHSYHRQLAQEGAVEQTEDELLGSPRMRSTGGALRAREGRSQGAGSPPSPVPGAQAHAELRRLLDVALSRSVAGMDASGLLHAETEDEGDGEGTQDLIWDQAGQSEMHASVYLPMRSHRLT